MDTWVLINEDWYYFGEQLVSRIHTKPAIQRAGRSNGRCR